MEQLDAKPWSSKYKCLRCLVVVDIDSYDLMSGSMLAHTYKWTDQNGEFILSYDETRDGETINLREGDKYYLRRKDATEK